NTARSTYVASRTTASTPTRSHAPGRPSSLATMPTTSRRTHGPARLKTVTASVEMTTTTIWTLYGAKNARRREKMAMNLHLRYCTRNRPADHPRPPRGPGRPTSRRNRSAAVRTATIGDAPGGIRKRSRPSAPGTRGPAPTARTLGGWQHARGNRQAGPSHRHHLAGSAGFVRHQRHGADRQLGRPHFARLRDRGLLAASGAVRGGRGGAGVPVRPAAQAAAAAREQRRPGVSPVPGAAEGAAAQQPVRARHAAGHGG